MTETNVPNILEFEMFSPRFSLLLDSHHNNQSYFKPFQLTKAVRTYCYVKLQSGNTNFYRLRLVHLFAPIFTVVDVFPID